MGTSSGEIWWSRRRRAVAVSLVFVAAAVLSAISLLALHAIATTPRRDLPTLTEGLGFVRLDRPATSLSLPSLRGPGTIDLARLAGKPIVMNFWSSLCYPCRQETPALASEARTMGGKVTFLGIDTADQRTAGMAFIRRYRVPYQVAFDPNASAAWRYGLPGLPVTFFLSRSAKTIIGENVGALTQGKLHAILLRLYGIASP
jgi:cytochrome c biogenesis protein CcmG, thiol:disulfide interchange protein DsbE